jgi:chromatin remodeling complex protein RSC6
VSAVEIEKKDTTKDIIMVTKSAPVKTSVPKAKKASVPKAKKVTPPKEKKAPVKKTAPVKKAAPVKKTPVKKAAPVKKTPAVVKPVVQEKPVVEEKSVVEPEAVQEPDVLSDTPYQSEFSSLLADLDSTLSLVRDLRSRVAKLEKQVNRDTKATNKKLRGRKKRVPNPNAEPSGFAKPGPVSAELSKFLGLAKDELISRTAVTKRINAYCKDNNLQMAEDKRNIIPDGPLTALLKINKDDQLTFFNLQKYMKHHFPQKDGTYPVA